MAPLFTVPQGAHRFCPKRVVPSVHTSLLPKLHWVRSCAQIRVSDPRHREYRLTPHISLLLPPTYQHPASRHDELLFANSFCHLPVLSSLIACPDFLDDVRNAACTAFPRPPMRPASLYRVLPPLTTLSPPSSSCTLTLAKDVCRF